MDIIPRKQALQLGLKRYYTGNKCVNGHVSEHYTRNYSCVECSKVVKRVTRNMETQLNILIKKDAK